jgi:hypothetical protein
VAAGSGRGDVSRAGVRGHTRLTML